MTKIFGDYASNEFTIDEIQKVLEVFTITAEDEKIVKRLFVKDGKLTVEYEDGV